MRSEANNVQLEEIEIRRRIYRFINLSVDFFREDAHRHALLKTILEELAIVAR